MKIAIYISDGLFISFFHINCYFKYFQLKYNSLRISIEQVGITIMEERSAFQFELLPIRLAHCNCHNASFCSNILVKLSSVSFWLFHTKWYFL